MTLREDRNPLLGSLTVSPRPFIVSQCPMATFFYCSKNFGKAVLAVLGMTPDGREKSRFLALFDDLPGDKALRPKPQLSSHSR